MGKVHLKWTISGFDFRPEVENMTLHNFRVNSIYPQSVIPIGSRVSEILEVPPKMNAILVKGTNLYEPTIKPLSNFHAYFQRYNDAYQQVNYNDCFYLV